MVNLNNINFAYRRNKAVLCNISLTLSQGTIYGLLGKNGEGKTTLLRILCGLLKPVTGECLSLGFTPFERQADFLQQIFLLPEEIYLPDVKARDYFDMYRPFYPSFSDEILRTCIESFDVETSAPLKSMSLGQKKKAAISLAMAANTPLLLMDEPTNGLDIPSKSAFRNLVASVMTDSRTVVISTHQVRDLESLIDAVVILDNHALILNNPLNEIGDKLIFRPVDETDAPLYSEPTPLGTMGVMANTTGEPSPVYLELLFNAAIRSKAQIQNILNPQNTLNK
ncbi:MAG: ABC transporter ATP-binding protein [Tannerellaceae bacterium]|jgi:ABC-2 type transport system ATP-binding protein|nr:ABC transporter ATP-binding protein [Tannerellaceae bacterium]